MDTSIRKLVGIVESIHVEGQRSVEPPSRIAAVLAVVSNPFSGRWQEDLTPLVDGYSELLGQMLSDQCADLLSRPIEAFGKGALVGTDGEIEHGSAIIHTLRFGNHVRAAALNAESLLPSVEKRGAPGASMDIPLKHIKDVTIRSHHQSFEVRIPDAPRSDEIVVAVAFSSGGRPLARLAVFGTDFTKPERQ
jgi:hypothetical protein